MEARPVAVPLLADLEMADIAVQVAVAQAQVVVPLSADLEMAAMAVRAAAAQEQVVVPLPVDLVVEDTAARQPELLARAPHLRMARGTVQRLAITRAGPACPAWEPQA